LLYIPEDGNIHNYHCEDLKSYTKMAAHFKYLAKK
jgi:hypothetical protein